MKKIPRLGEQEMAILKYVSEHSPAGVRDVSQFFEQKQGLARTTVLTVMERLRKKGFLSRSRVDGIFKYCARIDQTDVLSSKVSDFIEKTLGGSLSPLFNYFISSSKLTEEEIRELKELASKLELGKEG